MAAASSLPRSSWARRQAAAAVAARRRALRKAGVYWGRRQEQGLPRQMHCSSSWSSDRGSRQSGSMDCRSSRSNGCRSRQSSGCSSAVVSAGCLQGLLGCSGSLTDATAGQGKVQPPQHVGRTKGTGLHWLGWSSDCGGQHSNSRTSQVDGLRLTVTREVVVSCSDTAALLLACC